uniref:Uncharacterized protein n=1 Tax=virus sp. ctJLD79 TaxID=2827987 RepID=A0A8S5RED0_9VIRU|nr:MAG TPA: hypothetical protein [virus sp. ctJLD79]
MKICRFLTKFCRDCRMWSSLWTDSFFRFRMTADNKKECDSDEVRLFISH